MAKRIIEVPGEMLSTRMTTPIVRTPNSWALTTIGAFSLLAVTLITLVVYVGARLAHIGGAWGATATSLEMIQQNELRDKFIFISWAVLTIALMVTYLVLTRSRPMDALTHDLRWIPAPGSRLDRLATAVAVTVTCLVLALTLWNYDPVHYWSGFGWIGLVVGVLVATCIALSWFGPLAAKGIAQILTYGLSALLFLTLLLRVPALSDDFGDLMYTSEDLLAVSNGHFPLNDFIPQYSNLLGFAIAPVVAVVGSGVTVAFMFLCLLQIVTVVIVALMAARVGGRKMIAPAVIVFSSLVLATTYGQVSSSSYFATFPIRTFLPTVLIALTLLMYSTRSIRLPRSIPPAVLGFVAGVTVLNNLDFGIPAVVTIAVVLVVVEGVRWRGLLHLALFILTMAIAPLVYASAGIAVGKPVNFAFGLTFIRVFVDWVGFLQPIEPFGIHVGVVGFLVGTAVTGIVLLVQGRHVRTAYRFRQGLAMTMTGLWGLLGLSYFVGRSLTATLITAAAVPLGLALATSLPWIFFAIRHVGQRTPGHPRRAAGIRVMAGTLAFMTIAAVCVPLPTAAYVWDRVSRSNGQIPLTSRLSNFIEIMALPENEALRDQLLTGDAVQLLNQAGAIELEVGWKSGLQTNNAVNSKLSTVFGNMQCDYLAQGKAKHALMTRVASVWLQKNPQCQVALDFANARTLSTEGDGLVELAILR